MLKEMVDLALINNFNLQLLLKNMQATLFALNIESMFFSYLNLFKYLKCFKRWTKGSESMSDSSEIYFRSQVYDWPVECVIELSLVGLVWHFVHIGATSFESEPWKYFAFFSHFTHYLHYTQTSSWDPYRISKCYINFWKNIGIFILIISYIELLKAHQCGQLNNKSKWFHLKCTQSHSKLYYWSSKFGNVHWKWKWLNTFAFLFQLLSLKLFTFSAQNSVILALDFANCHRILLLCKYIEFIIWPPSFWFAAIDL